MIDAIDLKNFQTHRRLHIEFDRVTTLIGRTNAGKSSVLRALLWAALNSWAGDADAFISWGRSAARVKLTVDGRVITRAKGGQNLYKLDGKEYRAFGKDVPPAIAELLKLSKANFQTQLENHFWFSLPSSQVSRELNQIINLSAIDDALASIAAEQRRAKTEMEVCQSRLKAAKEQRDTLAWVADADVKLAAIELREQEAKAAAERAQTLETLLDRFSDAQNTALESRRASESGSEVVLTGSRASKLAKRAEKLAAALESLETAQTAAERRLPALPDPKLANELDERSERLASILSRLDNAEEILCQARASAARASDRLTNATKGRCPVCGKPMPSESSQATST